MTSIKWLIDINIALFAFFTLAYFHQYIYVLIALFKKDRRIEDKPLIRHKITAIIPARNEEEVIGLLIDSLRRQEYPKDLIDIVVVADNCTDATAEVCRQLGVTVFERFNKEKIGMGYAFEWLFERLLKDKSRTDDVFLMTNADNLFAPNYFEEINKVYQSGYRVVSSYRNSKNYGVNWITSGYALWFIRESRVLNGARYKLGTGCLVSGTGYVIDKTLIEEAHGWHWTMLTEDVELSTYCALNGIKIGYAAKAMFYDEQPETFKMSWRQRVRWVKGYLQVFQREGGPLMASMFRHWTSYDIVSTIAPAVLLTILNIALNLFFIVVGASTGHLHLMRYSFWGILFMFVWLYVNIYFHGLVTLLAEWRQIKANTYQKVVSSFTLPIFMFTYLPIFVACVFKRNVEWKQITHNKAVKIDEFNQKGSDSSPS